MKEDDGESIAGKQLGKNEEGETTVEELGICAGN
jgi:hypothetical protein